jgi:hypothetical protein
VTRHEPGGFAFPLSGPGSRFGSTAGPPDFSPFGFFGGFSPPER